VARRSGQLPDEWIDAMRVAARTAAEEHGGACQPATADRIAEAVIAALLSQADVIEQVRDRPLVDPVPPHATMDMFATGRRLAICTRPEPCASSGRDGTADRYGNLWFPVFYSNAPADSPTTLAKGE
jgi:hypothetical protein